MNIAIDVMGGDNFPAANLNGVFEYLNTENDKTIHFFLIGDELLIKKYLNEDYSCLNQITIIKANEMITDDDKPSRIFKTKPNSSIVKAIELLKNKTVDAVISAGNTGALLSTSLFLIGKISTIKRPALAPYVPSENKGFILCDAGANIDTKPEHLLQFAIMSKCYLQNVENIKNPKIGLLNIGKESNKGNDLVKQTYLLLKNEFHNFIGNIEPRYILNEDVDIIICDGFTGNIALKIIEGMFNNIYNLITDSNTNIENTLVENIKNKFDYQEHGGTPLLGIKGIVIKCHGSSNKKSIFNSIKTAQIFHKKQIIKTIEQNLSYQLDTK